MILLRANHLPNQFYLLIVIIVSTVLASCQAFFEMEPKIHIIVTPPNDKLDVGVVYTYPLYLKMPDNLNSKELDEYYQKKCVNISQNVIKNVKQLEGSIDLIKVHRQGKYCVITTYVPPDEEEPVGK